MRDQLSPWMRHETRATERRAPLVPDDAPLLVRQGVAVTVEESPQRAFPFDSCVRAGCAAAPAGAWTDAPPATYVLGVKEMSYAPRTLRHRHIVFGHAYKGQEGPAELLARFMAGGGMLLGPEYLTDGTGRRLATFGYWAGYMGSVLAVLHRRGVPDTPLRPLERARWDALLRSATGGEHALVVGALDRSGRGACDAVETAGITPVRWDVEETRDLDRAALLDHNILVNTVLVNRPVEPFLIPADLDAPDRRLSVVADITCDVDSECNVLPVYDTVADWDRPVRRLRGGGRPPDLIAVDNLPSVLPDGGSQAFSADLGPLLLRLGEGDGAWVRCLRTFAQLIGAVRRGRRSPHGRPSLGDRPGACARREDLRGLPRPGQPAVRGAVRLPAGLAAVGLPPRDAAQHGLARGLGRGLRDRARRRPGANPGAGGGAGRPLPDHRGRPRPSGPGGRTDRPEPGLRRPAQRLPAAGRVLDGALPAGVNRAAESAAEAAALDGLPERARPAHHLPTAGPPTGPHDPLFERGEPPKGEARHGA
ncbi:hypothetical protein ACWCQZ_42870 [Streptomyces sp. NPDC002285]